MNSRLAKAMDRAVERDRERATDASQDGCVCPKCSQDMEHVWDCRIYRCPDCRAVVEFYGPDEDGPGGYTVTMRDDDE